MNKAALAWGTGHGPRKARGRMPDTMHGEQDLSARGTLYTLLQNSRSVMVQGFWWCPWKAAIWEPTMGVSPLP